MPLRARTRRGIEVCFPVSVFAVDRESALDMPTGRQPAAAVYVTRPIRGTSYGTTQLR